MLFAIANVPDGLYTRVSNLPDHLRFRNYFSPNPSSAGQPLVASTMPQYYYFIALCGMVLGVVLPAGDTGTLNVDDGGSVGN